MISPQPFAKKLGLTIAGSVGCFVLSLFAREPADPWRHAKSLENQRPRDIRFPSPQRGREVGGEGDCQAVIGWWPFVMQQIPSPFAAEWPQFATPPHPQPLSPSREARGAEFSIRLL